MHVVKPSKHHKSWYVDFIDHSGVSRRVKGDRSKVKARKLGDKIVELVEARSVDDPPPAHMRGWIDIMDDGLREKLIQWGVLPRERFERGKTLVEQIDEWEQAILDDGNTERHATESAAMVRLLLCDVQKKSKFRKGRQIHRGCKFVKYRDIDQSSVTTRLAAWRRQGMSNQTSNHYTTRAKSFCTWMVQTKRDYDNLLLSIPKVNVDADRRRERRAMSIDEFRKFLEATRAEPDRFNMTGNERAMLYWIAAGTGFRADECRSLTRSCFDLSSNPATVHLSAKYTKNSKNADLPLDAELAEAISLYVKSMHSATRLFNMPVDTAAMIRKDLEAADIPYVDESGLVFDFHSLRHTRGVWLATIYRLHPKEIKDLMRVSSLALVERYSSGLKMSNFDWLSNAPKMGEAGNSEKTG